MRVSSSSATGFLHIFQSGKYLASYISDVHKNACTSGRKVVAMIFQMKTEIGRRFLKYCITVINLNTLSALKPFVCTDGRTDRRSDCYRQFFVT